MPLRTKCGSSVRSKSDESSESFESDVSILSSVSSLSSVSIFCGGATSISDGIFRWFGGFQCDSGDRRGSKCSTTGYNAPMQFIECF